MTLKDKLNSNNLKPDRKKKEERLECLTSRAERERERGGRTRTSSAN